MGYKAVQPLLEDIPSVALHGYVECPVRPGQLSSKRPCHPLPCWSECKEICPNDRHPLVQMTGFHEKLFLCSLRGFKFPNSGANCSWFWESCSVKQALEGGKTLETANGWPTQLPTNPHVWLEQGPPGVCIFLKMRPRAGLSNAGLSSANAGGGTNWTNEVDSGQLCWWQRILLSRWHCPLQYQSMVMSIGLQERKQRRVVCSIPIQAPSATEAAMEPIGQPFLSINLLDGWLGLREATNRSAKFHSINIIKPSILPDWKLECCGSQIGL